MAMQVSVHALDVCAMWVGAWSDCVQGSGRRGRRWCAWCAVHVQWPVDAQSSLVSVPLFVPHAASPLRFLVLLMVAGAVEV